MKKELYDLTIEEFTRLLLNYEEEYHLDLTAYNKDFQKEEHTLIGTYELLRDVTVKHPKLYKQIEDTLFDYRLTLNELDIYDYLDSVTRGFSTDRVKIVINEMECFYSLIYLENKNTEAMEFYIKEGLEPPLLEGCNFYKEEKDHKLYGKTLYIPDYDEMRKKAFYEYDFFYHRAIALLKSKISKTRHNKSLPSTLPKELNTPKAKELLDKAIEYNLLEDGYKWNSKLMTKRELAYLCYVLSNQLELSSISSKTDEGRNETNWKPFKELFNDNNLNNNLRGITTDDILTNTMDKIKAIYDF